MPLKFRDEAFSIATYLINCLPTRVIDNASPLERLFGVKPNYSLLKACGCACWPHLRPYNSHKLAFRSKQCVFIGYNYHHKGYKCLDISSGRIFILRDVVFDEEVFPFSEKFEVMSKTDKANTSKTIKLPVPAFVPAQLVSAEPPN